MTSTKPQGHRPAKTSRIELRATEDDSDLLDRAAAALGTDRSSFLLAQGRLAAQRVLADREQFVLDADGIVRYAQVVKEVADEPDYDAALAAIEKLV